MKPFDLQEALAGSSIITADRDPVRLLCADANLPNGRQLVGIVYDDLDGFDHVMTWTAGGHYVTGVETGCDLRLSDEPTECRGYVNLYRTKSGATICDMVATSRRNARLLRTDCEGREFIACVEINWLEKPEEEE